MDAVNEVRDRDTFFSYVSKKLKVYAVNEVGDIFNSFITDEFPILTVFCVLFKKE